MPAAALAALLLLARLAAGTGSANEGCGAPGSQVDAMPAGNEEEACTCGAATRTAMDGRQSSDDDEATARTDAQEATATWPPTGAVLVPPGTFFFGAEKSPYPADEEAPVIKAFIKNALWVDKTEATVAQFAKFADATNYQTTAEREGWSFVFEPFLSPATSVRETQAVKDTPWWVLVNGAVVDLQNASTSKHVLTHKSQYPTTGASWRKPEGPDSSSLSQLVEPDDQPVQPPRPQHQYGTPRTPAFPSFTGDRLDHPAVHISFHDAVAYCRWRGMRVPTEIEWEYAARGGLVNRTFPWGNRHDDLNTRANTFDGSRGFPLYVERDAEGNFPPSDGFDGSAPVASFAPNAFGLYDVSGNAWEWAIAVDKASGGATDKAVLRGGSFMCWHAHCFRYRVSARLRMDKDTGNYHTGVRCVADAQTGDGMAEL